MSFIYSYCPVCGGEIVTGSDGTIWESTCCCAEREEELYPEPEEEPEDEPSPDYLEPELEEEEDCDA
jgi:hypothetical protein